MTKVVKERELNETADLFHRFFSNNPAILKDMANLYSFLLSDNIISLENLMFFNGMNEMFENVVKVINLVDKIDLDTVTLAYPEGGNNYNHPAYQAFKTSDGRNVLYHLMDCLSQERGFYTAGMRHFIGIILDKADLSPTQFLIEYNYIRSRS
jgi:hypothetical protein